MQHIDGCGEPYGVHGTVGVPVVIIHELEDTRPAETFQELGALVLFADLRQIQR